tara:strand:+ start:365 stop:499 length:135 start_codon:yes stop_codon:yes gene_type:complete
MEKFLKAIETVTTWILGDQRDGIDRRVKKTKKKVSRRKVTRRKK